MKKKENDRYEDIINLPHHVSQTHSQMSRMNRAAQFSPFAALTGYDAAIKETARVTDLKVELDEYELARLSEKIRIISEHLSENPQITVTYFQADKRKAGGKYMTRNGQIKKVNRNEQYLVFTDGMKILFSDILEIGLEMESDENGI